jgi:hypothetical protein
MIGVRRAPPVRNGLSKTISTFETGVSMKMNVYAVLLGVLAILFVSMPAAAATVDGKWAGSLETPMGTIPVSYDFKADGAVLTGTTGTPDGGTVAIKNGKVDGDKIAFTVDLDFGGMAFTLSYTGLVAADQIKITGDFMGMPFEYVVKKVQ